jgi:hypothetical protein
MGAKNSEPAFTSSCEARLWDSGRETQQNNKTPSCLRQGAHRVPDLHVDLLVSKIHCPAFEIHPLGLGKQHESETGRRGI